MSLASNERPKHLNLKWWGALPSSGRGHYAHCHSAQHITLFHSGPLSSAPLHPSISLGPETLPLQPLHSLRIQAFQKHVACKKFKVISLKEKSSRIRWVKNPGLGKVPWNLSLHEAMVKYNALVQKKSCDLEAKVPGKSWLHFSPDIQPWQPLSSSRPQCSPL